MSESENLTRTELLEALRQMQADLEAGRAELADVTRELENTDLGIIALHAELDDAREAEAHLAAIVRSSDDAMFSMTPDATVARWNPGAERLLGYREDAVAGRPARELIAETGRADFDVAIKRLRSGDRASRYDSWCLRKDGSVVDVSITLSAMRDQSQGLIGYSAVISDITDRRRAEDELAAFRAETEVFAERDRIARDLHDHVIQQLFATGMSLESLLARDRSGEVERKIKDAVGALNATITQIRSTIFDLHRDPAEASSVRTQLLALASGARDSLGFQPTVTFEGPLDTMASADVAVHLLAVVREALSNTARHAHASKVEITVQASEQLTLVVWDNGRGIGEPTRRSGLANMAQRAEILGGSFVAEGPSGGGTRLVWRVPMEP